MRSEITLRREKHPKGCYDTIFYFNDSEKKFTHSDGDLDSSAGDLEEWCIVEYSEIGKVTELLKTICKQEIQLSEEEKSFVAEMKLEELKELFPYIADYCKTKNGSMRSFMDLLKEAGIDYKYSAYRSSSW